MAAAPVSNISAKKPLETGLFADNQTVLKVKSEQLQPGMVISRDVKNIDGTLLLPSGCELSERHIDILLTWGVAEVEVEASEEMAQSHDPLAQLPPEQLAQMTSGLRARFWKPDDFGPIPAEIFKIMLVRQARRLTRP
jgi:hypothetical protein